MFGRYSGDWDDEENLRTYLFTDRNYADRSKHCVRKEVECLPSEAKNLLVSWVLEHDLEYAYCFELVEQAMWVPSETFAFDGAEDLMTIADVN